MADIRVEREGDEVRVTVAGLTVAVCEPADASVWDAAIGQLTDNLMNEAYGVTRSNIALAVMAFLGATTDG